MSSKANSNRPPGNTLKTSDPLVIWDAELVHDCNPGAMTVWLEGVGKPKP